MLMTLAATRVLLVDDEPAIRELLGAILERESFEVVAAASAEEAVAHLDSKSFDAVVTDIRMETPLAGFQVVKRAAVAEPRPAILIVTAFPISPTEWKEAGADALFMKGQEIMRLPDMLRAFLNRVNKEP